MLVGQPRAKTVRAADDGEALLLGCSIGPLVEIFEMRSFDPQLVEFQS